jgi:hypothetical protein
MDIQFGNRCGSKSKFGNIELANAMETHFMNESAMASAVVEDSFSAKAKRS